MSNPLKRIKAYIDYKGIRISTFEKSAGLSNGSFGGQLKKGRTIGVDKLENILKIYPDLNAHWIVTGQGNMLIGEENRKDSQVTGGTSPLPQKDQKNYERTIQSLNGVIVAQQKTIDALEQLVALYGRA